MTLVFLRALSLSALRRVLWSTLLLLGGSFAMAGGIEGSGLSAFLARRMAMVSELPRFTQLALGSAGGLQRLLP